MVGKSKPITKADKARFEKLHEIGCIACRQNGVLRFPIEAHHLLSGGRRRGHQFCIPLCQWCHRGIPNEGRTSMQMLQDFGPSLAKGSKAFRMKYGTDDELLAEVNSLIDSD